MKKFEELLNKVPSTGTKELPKANNLPDSNVLIEMERGDFKITVYENGLYVYTEGKHTTVYAVDRCANYVDPMDTSEKRIPYNKIKDLEWYVPLMMFGMSRMEKNRNRQEQEHTALDYNVVQDLESRRSSKENAALLFHSDAYGLFPSVCSPASDILSLLSYCSSDTSSSSSSSKSSAKSSTSSSHFFFICSTR